MSIYKIQIEPGTPAVFDPNPLKVCVNDSVFWFNGDPNNAHWPAPSAADPTGFIAYQVPPSTPSSQVSFPAPTPPNKPITYVCIIEGHAGETGQIIVETCKKKKGAFGGKTKKGAFGRITR